jgi:hypothetical protein
MISPATMRQNTRGNRVGRWSRVKMSAWIKSRHMRRKNACPLYPNSDRESEIPQKVMSALPPKTDMSDATLAGDL